MTKQTWKKGDLCTVAGEGDIAFRVREAARWFTGTVYLERVDGQDGPRGHGREAISKLTKLHLGDIELVTTARWRR